MIRLFIGSSFNGEDAEAELAYEYSLRKHCSEPLDITWMRQSDDPSSPFYGWNTKGWATPFTAFRWAIPHICGFEGKAIFTDVDMLNLRDLSVLYHEDMEGKPVKARYSPRHKRYEFSVMVMDCAQMKDGLPDIESIKSQNGMHQILTRVFSNPKAVSDMDPRWNCLDGEDRPISDIWQLHFTDRNTQPWQPSWFKGPLRPHSRQDLVELWKQYLEEAKNSVH